MATLDGQIVYITGAAAGLGAALAAAAVARGAAVALLDRDADGVRARADELAAAGGRVAWEQADVTDPGAVTAAVDGFRAALGPCDVLINNAGITHIGAFRPEDVAAIRGVIEVNLLGAIHCTAACLPDITARRGGIVAVSSVAGFAPLLGRSGYAASKHALHGFFDTLRLELRETGVRVCIVCPSFIATGIRAHAAPAGDDENGRGRTVGAEADPARVAEQIYDGYLAGHSLLPVGRVAHLSRWLMRFAPRVYERLMLARIRDER
ncbi:MAG: SDR family oxidoreductase [Pseudomonadota bacterium]